MMGYLLMIFDIDLQNLRRGCCVMRSPESLTAGGQTGSFIQFIAAGVFFMSIVMNAIVAAVLAFGVFWVLKKITGGN